MTTPSPRTATRRRFLHTGLGVAVTTLAVSFPVALAHAASQAQGDVDKDNSKDNAADPIRAWRVIETETGKTIKWGDFAARLAEQDVVFVGERHDDPQTHRAEAALFEAVHKKRSGSGARLTLALEMLERDGQTALDDYLAGRTDEAALAKSVKLWSNYMTDYRPLVEYARLNHLPVVASNAPARLVRTVSRDGLAATYAVLTIPDRALVAEYVNATRGDAYDARFSEVIGAGHGDGKDGKDGLSPEAVRKFYEAQCVRDDTMAESIARLLDQNRAVFHVNGSFHSDAGLGTVARLRWRRPLQTRLAVVKIEPVARVADADPAPLAREADFVVFVPGGAADGADKK